MKKILKGSNISCSFLYFYIHFVVEVMCFYFLSSIGIKSLTIWIIPFIYDAFAFVPQALIGRFSDNYPKIKIGLFGIILLVIAILLKETNLSIFVSLLILTIGNSIMHICGAEATLKNANGKLSLSAIFVSGGSFGVITGKILGSINIPFYLIALLGLTMIPFYLLSLTYDNSMSKVTLKDFNYANKKLNPFIIILIAFIVVIVRGYIGYGIPTSWNKTIVEAIALYFTMGIGKALGGILSDLIGFRKVAFFSTVLSIPFLCFGDKFMFISLIGIMLFSMTMSLTLGLLVSVLKESPGLAFGITTTGLFIGTMPIFFIKITSVPLNIGLIIVTSLICSFLLLLASNKVK